MKTTKSIQIDFYRNLGKLFYAIAACDGNVNNAEYDTLKELVKNDWLPFDNFEDSFGTDITFQIEFVFNWLTKEEEFDTVSCFDDFIRFKTKHERLFTKPVKSLIMNTATAIASSFSGKNKSELIMLAKLNMNFKQTT